MLKTSHVFQKLMLVLSVLTAVSCNPDFDPPPNVNQTGGNGQILYNFSGTDVTCTGIGSATSALLTTEPIAWIVGINLDPNAADIASAYTHRVDFTIDNVYSMSDLVGLTIPLEDDVSNTTTDIHISNAVISTLNPVNFYNFTDINFQITSVTNNTINGTFSGTTENVMTGDIKNVTNGQFIDLYYVIE